MSKEIKAEDELCLESPVLQPNKPWLQGWLTGSLVTWWDGGRTHGSSIQEPQRGSVLGNCLHSYASEFVGH